MTEVTEAPELPKLDLELLVDMIEWARNNPHAESQPNTWYQDRWTTLDAALPTYGEDYDRLFHLWESQHFTVQPGSQFDQEIVAMSQNEACGSSYCIAGETVHLNGYRMLYDIDLTAAHCIQQEPTDQLDDKGRTIWKDVAGAEAVTISQTASRLLGITKAESSFLFDGENQIPQLEAVANALADRRGLPVPYPDAVGMEPEHASAWGELCSNPGYESGALDL